MAVGRAPAGSLAPGVMLWQVPFLSRLNSCTQVWFGQSDNSPSNISTMFLVLHTQLQIGLCFKSFSSSCCMTKMQSNNTKQECASPPYKVALSPYSKKKKVDILRSLFSQASGYWSYIKR